MGRQDQQDESSALIIDLSFLPNSNEHLTEKTLRVCTLIEVLFSVPVVLGLRFKLKPKKQIG